MHEFSNLGNFLKKKRIERNFTQRELASALSDVHTQFVSNWERGLCAPPSHCLQNLIELLKINREALVGVMLEDSRATIQAKVYKKKSSKSKKA